MKVEVYVEEISYGIITLEVENEDEIYEKAEDTYFDGNVNWTGGDFSVKNWQRVNK